MKTNTLKNFHYKVGGLRWDGGSWQSTWPTFSFSSCFCTSSGSPLTASALVRPSSVVLIHASSELRERKGYWCTLHLVAGLWVWYCQCFCTTVVHTFENNVENDIQNGTNSLQIGTATQRIRRLLQRSGRLFLDKCWVCTYVRTLVKSFGSFYLIKSLTMSSIA